jgi:transmembrane sensor
MDKSINELLRKGSSTFNDEKDLQDILSLFHQENLEFSVKAELNDLLDNTDLTGGEEKEIKHLFEKIWEKVREREENQKQRPLRLSSMLKVAASLILGIVIGSMVVSRLSKGEPNYYISMAPKGSVSQIILPDSSFICLNSGSTLKYTIDGGKGQREVFLNGEAWFQVQRSENQHFKVHIGSHEIDVMGTEFNVKAYAEDAEIVTTLEKGEIVFTAGSKGRHEQTELKQGQQLICNKETGNMTIGSVNTRLFTSWRENKLIFINMRFKELIVLLERKYGVNIRVTDPEILNYHYDGTVKNESILQVLNLLKLTIPIDYKINDQIIEITRKKS